VCPQTDHALVIHHDRLAESELPQTGRHGIDRVVVAAGVPAIRLHVGQFPKLDFHASSSMFCSIQ
jgi:hypothetical protein